MRDTLGFIEDLFTTEDIARFRLIGQGDVYALGHPDYLKRVLLADREQFRKSDDFRIAFGEGVLTVETGVAVESAGEARVELADGRTLGTDTLVWTGGIRGPAALGGERVAVGPDLEAAEGTFVLGDASDVVDTDGAAVPASAQTAVRQARVAATTIARRVRGGGGDETREYTSEDLGWVVSVGDGAVARVGNVLVNGESARAAKAAIGAGHLGSLGALTRASSLTASELGLPEPPAACGQTTPLDAALATLPADPAVPGQVGAPLVALAGGLTDAVTGGRLIDLTY
jgi:NADH dehydrogenase